MSTTTAIPLPKIVAEDRSEPRMPWMEELLKEFNRTKTWILSDAYPVLSSGPLGKQEEVLRLPDQLATLKKQLSEPRPVPVVMVGETGVGKSTLLNSLLDTEILPVGVIGAQTAAFVTISYSDEWRVSCQYIKPAELEEMLSDAYNTNGSDGEGGAGELADRAKRKLLVLLKVAEGQDLPPRDGIPEETLIELRRIVGEGEQVFTGDKECQEQLGLHAQGHLWPLTRSIDVEGPFEVLRSGVVISDLPGAGDMNTARVSQSAKAIEQAGQVLIAAETKGLKQSLLDQLNLNRLPHRLLGENEPVQVVLVGTKLDSAVPDPVINPQEVAKLGLDPADDPPEPVIFRAVCEHWSQFIIQHFSTWLRGCAQEQLAELSREEREARLSRILASARVVPTSAQDWKRLRRGRQPKYSAGPNDTGVPQLRQIVEGLAEAQLESTRLEFGKQVAELESSVLNAIERSETLLDVNISEILATLNNSQAEMKEAQERYAQQVADLRVSLLERFQLIREKLSLRIENAALKMRDQSESRVRQHLREPPLHWASLRATVRWGGKWQTNSGRVVNLRDAMGGEITSLVPQAWRTVADESIAKQMEEAQEKLSDGLRAFCAEIQSIFFGSSENAMSRRTVRELLEASQRNAASEIWDGAKRVQALRENTAKEMQARIDAAVDESIEFICEACSTDSGTGWNARSHSRISDGTRDVARKAQQRSQKVAEDALAEIEVAVLEFCKTAKSQMERVASELPMLLENAMKQSRLSGPEEMKKRFQAARNSKPGGKDRAA